jgi:tRNA threonylcarbamoyladenosine biosynthesis protein TsaE
MPEVWERIQGGRAISLNELGAAANELIEKCSAVKVWLFSGEIGAGKTTLIKTVCEALGVKTGMSSPTFSIVNEYPSLQGEKIYHFDFYRLNNEREAFDLGAEEYFDSGNFCFVEWPEKAPGVIPEQHIQINITPSDPTHRIIKYASHD